MSNYVLNHTGAEIDSILDSVATKANLRIISDEEGSDWDEDAIPSTVEGEIGDLIYYNGFLWYMYNASALNGQMYYNWERIVDLTTLEDYYTKTEADNKYVKGNAKIYYGTCSTAANVAQKDVVCSVYTRTGDPVKGDIIYVTFDNTNTAAIADLTLKVGNSTAKSIKYQGTTTIVNIPDKGYLIANMTYRFLYNGTDWVVMLNYDSNTNTLQRIYASSANVEFPLAGQVNGTAYTAPLAITSSNKACYGAVPNTAANKATINASTGKITIPSGLNLGTSSSKLGNIVFRNATNAYTTTVNSGTPTANKTITLPTETGTLALLGSPAFTGTPTAPTAAAGTNTTQIATTAFVKTAISEKANNATTLAGYGITDAKIENGSITLGENIITPLISHQDISSKENSSNKVTSISSSSTDIQYPSAKAVYDFVGATDAIPSYVKEEAESVLAKAFAHKGLGRTVRFIAVSDAHNDSTEASHSYTRIANKHCGQAVKYIAERIALDFVACLGDSTWAGVAHTTAQYNTKWLESDLQEMNSFLAEGFKGIPNIRVVGNHDQCATTDDNNVVSRLQNSGAYQLIGRYNAGISDGLSNYGYYDITNVKLRIIYLNTSDTTSTSSQGTFLAVSQAQKNWLCETLIDVNTKSDAAQWRIMLFSHAPLDMMGSIDTDILIPYTDGGTYGNYVFTNHDAKIIGNCHGHVHCYNVGYMSNKIRRFAIPNANFYDNNHYKNNASYATWNEDTTYPKTQNSRTDTSFSLVTLDMDSLICYVDNYGAGYDREFSVDYKSDPVPVNLFDKNDQDIILRARFNSSKQPVAYADEQLITGFIPASVGTTFEIETDKTNKANGYTGFLMLYNSNKQVIHGLSNATTRWVWSNDDKNGSITVPQTYNNVDYSEAVYGRFCLAYTDIDSIIITKE